MVSFIYNHMWNQIRNEILGEFELVMILIFYCWRTLCIMLRIVMMLCIMLLCYEEHANDMYFMRSPKVR